MNKKIAAAILAAVALIAPVASAAPANANILIGPAGRQ